MSIRRRHSNYLRQDSGGSSAERPDIADLQLGILATEHGSVRLPIEGSLPNLLR